jgi:hypothetical protein
VHVFVAALTHLYEMGQTFVAALYGSPTDPKSKYAHDVRNQAAVLALEGVLSVHEAVLNSEAARLVVWFVRKKRISSISTDSVVRVCRKLSVCFQITALP